MQKSFNLVILLEKHGFNPYISVDVREDIVLQELSNILLNANPDQLYNLLEEVIRTKDYLRYNVYPKSRHDPRWDDLVRCLELDGYRIEEEKLITLDPAIPGAIPPEDDLSKELGHSGLFEENEIRHLLDKSAEAFRKEPPDHNECLTKARIALETLGKAIAKARKNTHPDSFDENKWGSSLAYLQKSGLMTREEEDGLSGVYAFVSPGAHMYVGITKREMARLGRSLVI